MFKFRVYRVVTSRRLHGRPPAPFGSNCKPPNFDNTSEASSTRSWKALYACDPECYATTPSKGFNVVRATKTKGDALLETTNALTP